jgi:hypothetical protein
MTLECRPVSECVLRGSIVCVCFFYGVIYFCLNPIDIKDAFLKDLGRSMEAIESAFRRERQTAEDALRKA